MFLSQRLQSAGIKTLFCKGVGGKTGISNVFTISVSKKDKLICARKLQHVTSIFDRSHKSKIFLKCMS